MVHLVIVWCNLQKPFGFDFRHRPDVVLGGEHKLVVDGPLGFVGQHRRGMQEYGLIVLDGEITAVAFLVHHLHEETAHQRLSNVGVVILRIEVGRCALQA